MKTIGIIGGGAAGFFAAIQSSHINKKNKVSLYEQGGTYLKKVRISGGGRCNVTHAIFKVKPFCLNYPRGSKELISPFQQFQSLDTVEWFKTNGIQLKTESDGRMFPVTDSSETIINCFKKLVERNKVDLYPQHKVTNIKVINNQFELQFSSKDSQTVERLLLCTGSSNHGYELAKQLGHSITERAPSLFSFKIKHPVFKDLSGISFPYTTATLSFSKKEKFSQSGPLLITHQGLSGPSILKLSAWTAREMQKVNYKIKLNLSWINYDVKSLFLDNKNNLAKTNIGNTPPKDVTKRFWLNLLSYLKITPELKWADISKLQINLLTENLLNFECNINGQNRFKDEFVECGGVNLKEVNFKTMESKLTPNLFFAGEILDIDGVTGGFNFQNAWTSAWIAGNNLSK